MCDHPRLFVGKSLKKAETVDLEKIQDFPHRTEDFLVDPLERYVDEPGGNRGEQFLEMQPFLNGLPGTLPFKTVVEFLLGLLQFNFPFA